MEKFKEIEHALMGVLGLVCILVCSLKGHTDACGPIAAIVIGSAGASSAKSIFCQSKEIISEVQEK